MPQQSTNDNRQPLQVVESREKRNVEKQNSKELPAQKAKSMSRQASEESGRTKWRAIHPAERRAMVMANNTDDSKNPARSLNAFRRLSRADFTSFRRAGNLL